MLDFPSPPSPKQAETQKPDNVRLATIRDEPAILELLLADLEENATAVAPASIKRIMSQVEVCTRGKGGFALVIDGDDGPVAVALLHPAHWWWSDQTYLQEVVLYVAPEARRAHAGADLLEYEKWLSDEMTKASGGNRVFLMAGVTGTKRLAAKERLYERHMHRVGAFMIYPPIESLSV